MNGLVLHHRSHLNASAVIKSLPEAGVTFLVLRKPGDPTAELGPRPVSQFPTGLEENPIERYTRYKGLRQVGLLWTQFYFIPYYGPVTVMLCHVRGVLGGYFYFKVRH